MGLSLPNNRDQHIAIQSVRFNQGDNYGKDQKGNC